jgi:long-chain fatty acid transport protein
MKKSNPSKAIQQFALLALIASPLTAAMATNGYFSHGYGMKAKGMGGASVAMTDNAFAGANNPAIAAWAGDRLEAGVDVFMPERSMARTGSMLDASVKSDSTSFLIPEFGYNKKLSEQMGVGVAVYGNGGMNTDYAGGQINCGGGSANVLCGTGRLGVDLQQLIIAPTLAYKFSADQSVGVSLLLVQQIFKADGVQAFGGMSSAPQKLTNNGYDSSNGYGLRLGYLGKLNDAVTLGASYAPKVAMSKLSKYAGLFAEQGGLDIPESYTLGATFKVRPSVLMAVDYEHIAYAGVKSIANASSNSNPPPPFLGDAGGSGFGWKDANVWKLGVQWAATPKLDVRAGLNVGDNPVQGRDVTFNILAPGVITTHYTLGASYALSDSSELTVSYMYAPSNSVSGPSMYGGTETIKMNQQSLGIQFGWHWK